MNDSGSRAEARTALDHLGRWHLAGATGTLALEVGDRGRRLHLVEGRLHLPAGHPSAERLAALPPPADRAARRAWIDLLERLAASLDEGRVRFAELRPGHAALPAELGPALPTASLLRVGFGCRERRLDEGRGSIAARRERLTVDRAVGPPPGELDWSPEEAWALERLRTPMRFAELAADCPFDVESLRAALAGLVAVGRVRAIGDAVESSGGGLEKVEIGDLADRLAERVAISLDERPLPVTAAEYRQRIADLLARAGELGHDELLGVEPDVGEDALQEAFEELARWVHPSNARRFELGERAAALRFLFERATEAYRTLADPQMRAAYLATRRRTPAVGVPDGESRQSEAREMARALFARARYEESVDEIYNAVQLAEQAARTDPRAEYWCALGRLQARNKAWRTRAIESYRHAVELDPQSGEARYALGRLYEDGGDLERARGQYQIAATSRPPHPDAKAALERLGGAARGTSGALGRLFRRE